MVINLLYNNINIASQEKPELSKNQCSLANLIYLNSSLKVSISLFPAN
jgi:hypothetical protein